MLTHADQERLVRTIDLVYVDERVAAHELPADRLPANGISLLSQVRVTGHDGDQPGPATSQGLGYTPFASERRRCSRSARSVGPSTGRWPARIWTRCPCSTGCRTLCR